MNTPGQYDLNIGSGKTEVKERKAINTSKDDQSPIQYLGYIGEMGFGVALPIVGGALIGSALDKSHGTYPKATLGCILAGVVIGMAYFIKTVMDSVRGR